jgi:phosphoglycolate phosphatase-like HAD superfamily hydrolase
LDGVVLSSNETKASCFAKVVTPTLGTDIPGLVEFALGGRGIPRRLKFERACIELASRQLTGLELDAMCTAYAQLLAVELATCPLMPGIVELLELAELRFVLCTAAPEDEARGILESRGLDHYFDRIAGSPRSKVSILLREALARPIVFFGDGEADAESAAVAEVPFVYVGVRAPAGGPAVETFLPTEKLVNLIEEVAR